MALLAGVAVVSTAAAAPREPGSARIKPQARHSQTSPDSTGTIKPPGGATGHPVPASQADDETLPPLFNLPAASRARMHACGERWQAKKMAGDAGDEIWREFATKCLSAKD